MSKQISIAKFAAALVVFATFGLTGRGDANPTQYDLSWMEPQSRRVAQQTDRFGNVDQSGQYASPSPQANPTGSFGGISRPTTRQSWVLPTNRAVPVQSAITNILADYSVDNAPIRSGKFDYGFPKTGPAAYRGAYAGQNRTLGNTLPQVSTSSVDINTVDLSSPFGSSFGGGGGSGTGGSEPQAPPALPPGWTGVMCHGIYAGAIPPGGSVEAFWRGEYGFAGDEAQQAALLREGQWLLANGQIGP